MAEPKGTFKVRLDVPVEYHDALRQMASRHRRSMASFVRDLLLEALAGNFEPRLPAPPPLKGAREKVGAPPPERPRGRPRKEKT